MKAILTIFLIIPFFCYSQSRLPYKVGNGWFYSNLTQKWGSKIIDSYHNDGSEYFLFDNKIKTLPFFQPIRVDSQNVYWSYIDDPIDSLNSRWIPFFYGNQNISEIISFNDTTRYITQETGDTIVSIWPIDFYYSRNEQLNVFGINDSVEIRVSSIGLISHTQLYSEKFGLLQETESEGGGSIVLKGCIIDGTAYGDTTGWYLDTEDESPVPIAPSLLKNYPNPFNPVTKIPFSLPFGTTIRLSVFDMTGKEVSVLRSGYMPPGIYTQIFNASGLSSGAYIVRLQAGKYASSQVVILSK